MSKQHGRWIVVMGLLLTHSAVGATKTWDGGGSPDFNWSVGSNWNADAAPAATGDTLIFAGVTGLASTNNGAVTALVNGATFDFGSGAVNVGAITFAPVAGAFVLDGSTINWETSANGRFVYNLSGVDQTLNMGFSDVTGGTSDRTISAGGAKVTFNGNINFGNDRLFPEGTAGTVVLNGSNSGDGTTGVTAGSNQMRVILRNNVAGTQLILGSATALGNAGSGSYAATNLNLRGFVANQGMNLSTTTNLDLSGSSILINAPTPVSYNGAYALTIGNILTQAGNRDFNVSSNGPVTVADGIYLSNDQTGRQLVCNVAPDGLMTVNGGLYDTFHSGGLNSGTSTLRKDGAGTLIFNGEYAGAGNFTVNGGTLGGTGTVHTGVVTVNGGGTLAPGASIGTLSVSNAFLSGTMRMELNRAASPNSDRLAAAGLLTLGGTLSVTNLGGALQIGDSFDLFNAGSVTGAFAVVSLPAGYGWNTSQLASNGIIQVTDAFALAPGWDGGGSDANWSNGTNWDGNLPPAPTGASLTFSGSAGLSNTNDGRVTSLGSPAFVFTNTVGGFVLNGSAIGLETDLHSGFIYSDSPGTQTLNMAIASLSNGSWDRTIHLSAGGTVVLNGILDYGNDRLFPELSGGTIVLNGANTGIGTGASPFGTGVRTTMRVNVDTHVVLGNKTALGSPNTVGTEQAIQVNSGQLFLSSSTSLTGDNAVSNSVVIGGGPRAFFEGSNDLELAGNIYVAGGNRDLIFLNTATTLVSGNVYLSETETNRFLVVNVGAAAGAAIISGVIANNKGSNLVDCALTKTGAGTLTLAGSNTYSGLTSINAGTLRLANSEAMNSATGSVVVAPGGTLDLNGTSIGDAFATQVLNGDSGTLINGNTNQAAAVTNALSELGDIVLGGAGNVVLTRINASHVNTAIKIGSGTLTLAGTQHNNLYQWNVMDGVLELEKTVAGQLAVDRTLTISGGVVRITGTTGNEINNGENVYVDGGVLDLNGHGEAIGGLWAAAPGGAVENNGTVAATLYIGGSTGGNSSGSYAGTLRDGLGVLHLAKEGSATNVLSGTNTYSGTTTVSAGGLLVNGQHTGGGNYAVNFGSLGGTGAIRSGTVTAAAGARLRPGTPNGIGILTVSNLTLSAGAQLDYDLHTPADSDRVVATGTLALNGLQFTDIDFNIIADFKAGMYVLVDAQAVTGTLGAVVSGILGPQNVGATLSVNTATGDLILELKHTGMLILVK